MGISEINYDIQFEPLFSNFTFKGMEILSFKTTPSNKFMLNCAEIKISKCYIISKSKTIETKFKLNAKNESLSITAEKKVSGKIKLCIEYAGVLNDRLLGFYRSKYTDPNGKTKYLLLLNLRQLMQEERFHVGMNLLQKPHSMSLY